MGRPKSSTGAASCCLPMIRRATRSRLSKCLRTGSADQRRWVMTADLDGLAYLLAGVLFILALRGLSNPETSRRGNLFGIIGMAIAIVTTLVTHPPAGIGAWALVVIGMAVGGGTRAVVARRAPRSAMAGPVSAFHSPVGLRRP